MNYHKTTFSYYHLHYNKHTKEYIQNTKGPNMKEYYEVYESYLKPNAKILDVGLARKEIHPILRIKDIKLYL